MPKKYSDPAVDPKIYVRRQKWSKISAEVKLNVIKYNVG